MALGTFLVLPTVASAAVTYTYYPSGSPSSSTAASNPNDLNDLDHLYYYSWNLSNMGNLTSQGIVSASITFKDLYNWNTAANVLHLDLLDSATLTGGTNMSGTATTVSNANANGAISTVRQDADNAPASPTKQSEMVRDKFDGTNALSSASRISLSDRSFVAQNTLATNTATLLGALTGLTADVSANTTAAKQAWANTLISPPGWTLGTSLGANGGVDYTYTFTAAQLTTLGQYITNGGDIALAFDPDCHFYNDGISFQIVTNGTGIQATAVPEPATLVLLAAGLVVAGRYRRLVGKGKKK